MTLPTTPAKVVEALRSAGATEEIIAVAVKAGGECGAPHRASEAARKRPKRAARRPPDADLLQALYRAAEGHADPDADIAPIAALLDQGCPSSARRPSHGTNSSRGTVRALGSLGRAPALVTSVTTVSDRSLKNC